MPSKKRGLKFSIVSKVKKFTSDRFLSKLQRLDIVPYLRKYAQIGVLELMNASPVNTGLLASSWKYDLYVGPEKSSIVWSNTDVQHGCNVAILVQYGHATPSGVFVQGIDFINPALKPTFDNLAQQLWKEVLSA